MAKAEVAARPTKPFFVEMLTRDIELKDAVLDLLDNCVDAILRVTAKRDGVDSRQPYKGFRADITATPDGFTIIDNCGGFARDIAIDSAFMFGWPDEPDAGLKTVGMSGIGMKRAIFKMGRTALVISQPDANPFQVAITEEWMADDNDWSLDLAPAVNSLPADGTAVRVSNLHPSVARQFDSGRTGFLSELRRDISRLYSLIIRKGFEVTLNGAAIEPVHIHLLVPDSETGPPSIRPYVLEGEIGGVEVSLAVGFYRSLTTEDEVDQELHMPQPGSHCAGWTVICNDRVVLYGDRSLVTGWGRGRVPRFHNQFLAIAGVVVFESTDSLALPLNTTKRGLDTSSAVYLSVLNYMQEGTRLFTSFTNHWKSRGGEISRAFQTARLRPFEDISATVPPEAWQEPRRVKSQGGTARVFRPNLPRPADQATHRRISFNRPTGAIRIVAEHLFADPDAPPRAVGEQAFDDALTKAERDNG